MNPAQPVTKVGDRYRGKAGFYAIANEFFWDNKLLPTPEHTLGGLRHSYESRMRRLIINN